MGGGGTATGSMFFFYVQGMPAWLGLAMLFLNFGVAFQPMSSRRDRKR